MSDPGCDKIPRSEIPGGTWTVLRIPGGSRGTLGAAVFGKPVTAEDMRLLLGDEDDQ